VNAGMFRHVGEQREVAVRQRADREAAAQALEPRDRVGPGIEAVPDEIEPPARRFVDLYAMLREQVVEDHAMELVDPGPAQLAAATAVHGRRIAGPPFVRELAARDAEPQGVDLPRDGAVPVDDRAEDVEGEDGRQGSAHRPWSVRSSRRARARWPRTRR